MLAKDIVPLTELRSRLSENFQRIQETGRPLFVTTNGRTAAVVLSPETYDAMRTLIDEIGQRELAENLALIRKGRRDFETGRVRDAREGIRQLAERHGIDLSR